MSLPSDAMHRYAALLAGELRQARPAGVAGSRGSLARELLPGYLLFKGRFGASEEATAVFRAEIAKALGGDEEGVAAALEEIASAPGAPEKPALRWRRLWSELVFGCVLLAFGLMIGFGTARATLTCQRPPASSRPCATASCRLQWHVLFGSVPLRDTDIECLVAAEHVRETSSTDSAGGSYRVMLTAQAESGRYAMNAGGGAGTTLAATTQLNEFLGAPDQSSLPVVLAPMGSDRWMAWLGDVLLILGLVTVLSVPVQIMWSWFAGR